MYLHVLTRGASPAAACGQVGVSALDVLATIEQDQAFSERLDQVTVLLSQNVAAALYRSAMEGSVSAQTFFLKNQPPPNWHQSQASEAADDPFSRMSDDELLAYCRASGIDWPTETAAGTDPPAVSD